MVSPGATCHAFCYLSSCPPCVLVFPGHWLLVITKNLLYGREEPQRRPELSLAPPSCPRPPLGWETEARGESLGHRSRPSPCLLGDSGSCPQCLPLLLSSLCAPSSCRESELQLRATAWLLHCPQEHCCPLPCPPSRGPLGLPAHCQTWTFWDSGTDARHLKQVTQPL